MKFTVVTICLNAERYLEEAMTSVVGQTWHDFEYLLVDGGSTDGTQEIIRRFAEKDSRLRWVTESKHGIAHAMNCGLKMSEGDVIAYLHSDDRYADGHVLEKVASVFQDNPATVWVTGGLREVDEQSGVVRVLPPLNFSKKRLLRNNIIYHPATFVKTSTMRSLGGFDESLRYAMDYDLWLRLTACSGPCQWHEALADFRAHSGSISTAQRMQTLKEEYSVRLRYLENSPWRWLHACYQWFRLKREVRKAE